jgi:hypothetical protein
LEEHKTMSASASAGLGWLLAGLLAGWLGHWLFDRLYRRDGAAAADLTQLQMDSIHGALDRLGVAVAERGTELQALRSHLLQRQADEAQAVQAAQQERDSARAAADAAEHERVAARVMLGAHLQAAAHDSAPKSP